jgi:Tfp pilus assembly protein PilX
MNSRAPVPPRRRQRGATLIVSLIIMALITLLVVNAFTTSSSGLRAVANVQAHEESIAAANEAMERVISSPFQNALGTQTWTVDLNKDGVGDFTVVTSTPVCIRTLQAAAAYPSDVELGAAMSAGSTWNVDWDIQATVTDSTTGSSVAMHQGVRTLLSQSEKEAACP